MSVEDILSALYGDPQSGMTPDTANPLNAMPGGLYQNLGVPASSLTNDQTTDPTPVVTNITQLLTQAFGFNPFMDTGPAKGKTVHQMVSGTPPLQGVPPQFAQAVVEEMLRQQQDITDSDALTQKIKQYWENPDTKALYGLLQGQGASPSRIASTLTQLVKFGDQPATMPFDQKYMTVSGYGFMAPDKDYASGGHEGIDYGLPANTPLVAPFAGRATVNSGGPLGNSVTITFGNGWRMVFGHLNMATVQNGQIVNPGTFLGYSGNTGNSNGAHLHLAIYDPSGRPVDPSGILSSIRSGKSIGSLMVTYGSGLAGPGISHSDQMLRSLGIYDPQIHQVYERANTVFRTYFGREPNDQELLDIVGHGNDEASIETYVRSMPSHIAGVAMGDYTDLRKLADSVSQKIYGHDSNDQIIKNLYDSQATTPNAVNFWYGQQPFQPGKDVSPIIYDQVYKSAAAYSKATWNQEPHPLDLQTIYNAAGGAGQTATPPSDTKASLNATA